MSTCDIDGYRFATMSIAALTSLAAVRNVRVPTKQDVGKTSADDPTAKAGITDLLVSQVPTELVAPYTAVMAAIIGVTAKPSKTRPHPDQLVAWRWITFAILVIGTIGLVWEGTRRKSTGPPKIPVLEITAALAAAVGWAFALPDSPISPYLHSTAAHAITPLLVGFAAILFTAITASALRSQRGVKA
jgi:hypothetical protein